MTNSRKKLLTNSFIYIVLGFLPLAANFFLAPVYSRYISPEEYGIITLSLIFQGFLTLFITFGLEGGFSRLYFNYHKKEKLVDAFMSTTLLAVLAGGVLFWVVLYFFGDLICEKLLQNNQFTYQKYGNLVFFITLSTALHTLFLSYYRNREDALKYSLVALSFFFTSVAAILIGIVYFKAEAMGNIMGRAVSATLVVGVLVLLYFSRKGITFKVKYLKKSLIYSLPLIPYLFLLMLYNNVDKIMVEQYFVLETLGLYNFAFQLASVMSVFIYAIVNAVSPHIYKLMSEKDNSRMAEIKKINILFHLIVTGVISLSIAAIVPVLEIFIAERYQAIQDYISLLILVYVFQLYYVIYTVPLFFYDKTKILPWISLIVLIVGIVSNIIFIPLLGIYGVCLALFLTKLSQFLVAYFFVRYYGFNRFEYFSLYKNHIVSFSIILFFGVAFVWNYINRAFPAAVINIIPLLVFIVCVFILYRREQLSIKYIYGKLTS